MAGGPTNPAAKRIAQPLVAAIGFDNEIGSVHGAAPGPRGQWNWDCDGDNMELPQRDWVSAHYEDASQVGTRPQLLERLGQWVRDEVECYAGFLRNPREQVMPGSVRLPCDRVVGVPIRSEPLHRPASRGGGGSAIGISPTNPRHAPRPEALPPSIPEIRPPGVEPSSPAHEETQRPQMPERSKDRGNTPRFLGSSGVSAGDGRARVAEY